jgi:hypothetical protein
MHSSSRCGTISPLHLPYISRISPVYLPHISRHLLREQALLGLLERVERREHRLLVRVRVGVRVRVRVRVGAWARARATARVRV